MVSVGATDVLPDALEALDVDHRHQHAQQRRRSDGAHGARHGEKFDAGQAAMDRAVEAGRDDCGFEMDARKYCGRTGRDCASASALVMAVTTWPLGSRKMKSASRLVAT